jgi:hypothetical protein
MRDAVGQHVHGLEGPVLLELEFPPALRGGIWLADILAESFHWIFSGGELWRKNRAVAKSKF